MAKQHKKPSLWKSASVSVKPSQQSDGLKHENSMKRRSFWRHEPKATSTAPAVQHPALRQADDDRTSKHRPGADSDRLLQTDSAGTTGIKSKRSSLRLNLRRSVSSQSTKRNSLRFSFLANGAGDTDDEGIPAVPAIPANIKRHKSSPKDAGRHISMAVQPGTAVTSDEVQNTSAPPRSRNSLKRQSLSKLITGRKSLSDIPNEDTAGNKRKHRSWFSVHGSQSSDESPIPPMPALPDASGVHPSEAAFHAFLHNIHNAAPKGANTTDYERFLRASRAFDASIPTPPRGNSFSEMPAPRPRPISTVPATALPIFKERSPRRPSRCRPQKADNDSTSTTSPTSPSLLSNEQQREWNKLRRLMEDQPSGSDNSEDGQDNGEDDDDGVLGMLRQLSRDEDKEYSQAVRDARRRRDRETYLGVGLFENKDALAALECGPRR